MTVPLKMEGSSLSFASMSSSLSKHSADPWKSSPSLPVILATEPSGARLPYRICRCPLSLMGLLSGISTCCPSDRGGHMAKFSAIVLPVTVMHDPSMRPFSMRYLSTAGVPPILWMSSMTYLPLGLRSAMKGVLSLHFWKSSNVSSMPAASAMAIRCSTALVEPPSAITVTIAFSKAARVMISKGLRSILSRFSIAAPANRHSSIFRGSSAGTELLYGRHIPRASMAVAMVFAVYMPPHAPAPGHELRTVSMRVASSDFPATNSP
mmetsp:Transcript_26694/g.44767  ORF Transcript_26694/g.44767 Transcript_26694/m.44767 type:complete len:265 (-) Transcript_26694:765-1559(-)